MKKNIYLLFLAIILSSNYSFSQESDSMSGIVKNEESKSIAKIFFGLGLGVEYGVIGGQIKANIGNYVDLHFGGGYNSIGVSVAFGTSVIFFKNSSIRPKLNITFGNTHIVNIENASQYNKAYYGLAFGFGTNIFFSKKSKSYLSIGLNLFPPSQQYIQDIKRLRDKPNIYIFEQTNNWGIAVGYHFYIAG